MCDPERDKEDLGLKEVIRSIAESATEAAITLVRYREFMARKKAEQLLTYTGMGTEMSERDKETILEFFKLGLLAGMSIPNEEAHDPNVVQETADKLVMSDDPEHPSFPQFRRHAYDMVCRGISFRLFELEATHPDPEITAWREEFSLLIPLDPHHNLWFDAQHL